MSYLGWNGRDDSLASRKLLGALTALSYAGVDKNLTIEMNDMGFTFDEIANYVNVIIKTTKLITVRASSIIIIDIEHPRRNQTYCVIKHSTSINYQ